MSVGSSPPSTRGGAQASVFSSAWWQPPAKLNPYQPGSSPFHTKGSVYRETRTFFDGHYEGGMDAFVAQMADPALQAFIGQPFLASGWYDAMPIIGLIRAEADAMKLSPARYLAARSEWQAARDTAGVYAAFLTLATPGSVARILPKMMIHVFDFPAYHVSRSERGRLASDFSGVPAYLAGWLFEVVRGYTEIVLKRAGAKEVHVERGSSHDEPAQLGVPMVGFECDVRWT